MISAYGLHSCKSSSNGYSNSSTEQVEVATLQALGTVLKTENKSSVYICILLMLVKPRKSQINPSFHAQPPSSPLVKITFFFILSVVSYLENESFTFQIQALLAFSFSMNSWGGCCL